jgi:peptide-methionine (S)-S-oxide reductase
MKMERAVFGANVFFSQKGFLTGLCGIESVQLKHVKELNVDIVDIWFNPWKVSYHELLELFFDLHDPTYKEGQQSIRQSFIYFSNINQLKAAKQKKDELKHLLEDEIITKITPVGEQSF